MRRRNLHRYFTWNTSDRDPPALADGVGGFCRYGDVVAPAVIVAPGEPAGAPRIVAFDLVPALFVVFRPRPDPMGPAPDE